MKTPIPMRTLVARQRSLLGQCAWDDLRAMLSWCRNEPGFRSYIREQDLFAGLNRYFERKKARTLFAELYAALWTPYGFERDALCSVILQALGEAVP